MKKSDIEQYYDRHNWLPSVNVKVHDAWRWSTHGRSVALEDMGATEDEADRFHEWCEEHAEDDKLEWLFEAACESGWESAQCDAHEVFGRNVRVESRGRCGGHLVVIGLPDIEEWDAIAVSRWARFARWCRGNADYVPHEMATLAFLNVWDPAETERAAAALPIVSCP